MFDLSQSSIIIPVYFLSSVLRSWEKFCYPDIYMLYYVHDLYINGGKEDAFNSY